MARPIFIYDADCGFCRRWVARWRGRTRDAVRYVPLQTPLLELRFPVKRADARKASLFVEDGRVYDGATAVFRALRHSSLRPLVALARLPGLHAVARFVYRRVAHHRVAAARIDRLLVGRGTQPSRSRGARWLFLRGLGGVYFTAFWSLSRQVLGLYGERGILPVAPTLARLDRSMGKEARRYMPSLFWRGASDRALVNGCRAGLALSVLLALNVAPALTSAALWALWLSFVSVGRDFLGFQWDALLLEAGAVAPLYAPWGVRPGLGEHEPPLATRLLLTTLFFRLYFESGLAKWRSGDETWRKLTACSYFHETTPLPTPLGWYAHHLPPRAQKASTAAVLAGELGLPFLAFAPRRLRCAAVAAFTALQASIAATGNYAYFNWLSAALGLPLLDDEALPSWLPVRSQARAPDAHPLARAAETALVLPVLALAVADVLRRSGVELPERVQAQMQKAHPWRLVSSYGLFAVMTVERPEITLEGSMDGKAWEPFVPKYKPSEVEQRPKFIAPHQPRLDWQLWFAALSSWPPGWFVALAQRLLEGSPDVQRLFRRVPFGGEPPRFVRAVVESYRMTSLAERRETGAWWRRTDRHTYLPAVTLAPS